MNKIIYIVATPIGNLSDISARAIKTLMSVDLILAEDTRRSKILLDHYGIQTTLKSFHKFNEKKSLAQVEALLSSYPKIALISDAGTPLISDPGLILIDYAMTNQIPLIPIPGPSALSTLLSVLGFPDPSPGILFIGFLDHKQSAKQKQLEKLLSSDNTFIFFDSPNRINSSIQIIAKIDPKAQIILGRELTKMNEEVLRFRAGDAPLIKEKGEITVAINPSKKANKNRSVSQNSQHKSMTKELATSLANYLNLDKKTAYELLLELKDKYQKD